MSKPMPSGDFRAVRIILEPEDFAISDDIEEVPTDLIPEKTWHHLVGLPDDVAVRTSSHEGTILHDVSELHGEFGCVSLAIQKLVPHGTDSPFVDVILDAIGELQASIYNALTGYYRVAFSALRNVVEYSTIGLHLELSGDQATFQDWLAGKELKFGWAADLAPRHSTVRDLEAHLMKIVHDDLFRQTSSGDPGGFARRLFAKLSKYTHGGPGYTDADLWKSNGPIFVSQAFLDWAETFIQVFSYCLVGCKLAQPRLASMEPWSKLTIHKLFDRGCARLQSKVDGLPVFKNLPASFW